MRKLVRQLMAAMVCGLGLMGTAIAQSSTAALESQMRVDGKLWVVTKGRLQDFTLKADKEVADFDHETEAQAAADRLNDALKGSDVYRWLYQYHKRPKPAVGDDIEPFPGKSPRPAFEKPALRTVDPGPLKKAEKEVPSIKGKRGKGKIGNKSVMFDFREDGTVVISGEMEGTGKWEQTGSALRMTTEVSTYRGTIDGDKASGLRFVKDNTGPLAEWSVVLNAAPKDANDPLMLVGTSWHLVRPRTSLDKIGDIYEIHADGKIVSFFERHVDSKDRTRSPDPASMKWIQENGKLIMLGKNWNKGTWNRIRECVPNGDSMKCTRVWNGEALYPEEMKKRPK